MEKSNIPPPDTLQAMVDRLADQYAASIGAPEKYRKLFKSAFKSGCFAMMEQLTRAELDVLLEKSKKENE